MGVNLSLFSFLSKITKPLSTYTSEIPERLSHDIGTVNTFVSEAPERASHDIDTVSTFVSEVPERLVHDVRSVDHLAGDVVRSASELLFGNDANVEPTPASNPKITAVGFDGEVLDDRQITYAEKDEVFRIQVEVSGIDPEAQAEVVVVVDGSEYIATLENGHWIATVPVSALTGDTVDGGIYVTVTDADGQVTTDAANFDAGVTVDLTEPTPVSDPVIEGVSLAGAAVADGQITFDENDDSVQVEVAVSGIAEGAAADVSVTIGGVAYTAALVDGVWVADVPASGLSEGEVVGSATVSVTDAGGEFSTATLDFTSGVTVDLTEPTTVSDPVIEGVSLAGAAVADGQITFDEKDDSVQVEVAVSGIAEGAAADVSVTIGGVAYAAALVDGIWVADVPASGLSEGEVVGSATVSVTNAGGEVSAATLAFTSGVTVDFTEPTPVSDPVIGEVFFHGNAVHDGEITYDEKSDTIMASVYVSGIANGASAEVSFSIDGETYDATYIAGAWETEIPVTNLENGKLSGAISVKVVDKNGSTKTTASSFHTDIIVDLDEPVVVSDPIIDSVSFEGDILKDGKLTSDEVNETFEIEVEVSGIVDGAQIEVSVEIDGNVYQANEVNGTYVADVPASELVDGEASGTAILKVTDANGETSHASSDFNTTIETDFTDPGDGVYGPPVQSTGEVELDIDSMTTYTTGKGQMGVESDFNITFEFALAGGGVTPEVKAAVIQMGEYISSLITGDLADYEGVDDVVISVADRYRDGEGGIHASAGVSYSRESGPDAGMVYKGLLSVDEADIASMMAEGTFNDIILHEMLHALGFGDGEVWESLVDDSQEFGGSYRFTGRSAIAAYKAQHAEIAAEDAYSDMGVQVESDYGLGNAGSHWDRATFDKTEGGLMAAGTSEYYYGGIDAMTLAAFEDMGYETVWDAADPGAQPGDYDDLPAAVQDPDHVDDPEGLSVSETETGGGHTVSLAADLIELEDALETSADQASPAVASDSNIETPDTEDGSYLSELLRSVEVITLREDDFLSSITLALAGDGDHGSTKVADSSENTAGDNLFILTGSDIENVADSVTAPLGALGLSLNAIDEFAA